MVFLLFALRMGTFNGHVDKPGKGQSTDRLGLMTCKFSNIESHSGETGLNACV